MKARTVNGARHPAVGSGPGVRRPPGPSADPAPAELEQALAEVADLERALATNQRQLRGMQERIETLVKRDSRLKQRFLRLARKEAQVRHVAYHDELTGLPNRSLLLDRFNQAVAQGARQGRQVALLFLDLDGFKNVNDRFGHAAGDKLLQQVAGRLAACIRAGDTACRYGGDEFVIMLPEVAGEAECCHGGRENPRPPYCALCRRRRHDCGDGKHRHGRLSRRRAGLRFADTAVRHRHVSRQGSLARYVPSSTGDEEPTFTRCHRVWPQKVGPR